MNVTIILPTRNRDKLLTRAIESVLCQDHKNLRLIVLDNCSNDETSLICNHYAAKDQRFVYIRHQDDIGAAHNFLYGIKRVNTDYFCMMSDDDFLCKSFIHDALSLLSRFPAAGFAILDTIFVDENLCATRAVKYDQSINYYCEPSRIHFNSVPMTWTSMLFRSDLIPIIVDAFDPLDKGSDIRVIRSAAARYPYVYMSKPGAFFMVHPGSLSSAGFPVAERIAYFCQTLNRYAYICLQKEVLQEIKDAAQAGMVKMLIPGIREYMLTNSMSTLREYLVNPHSHILSTQVSEYAIELQRLGLQIPGAILRLLSANNNFSKTLIKPLSIIARLKRRRTHAKLQAYQLRYFSPFTSYAI